MTVNQINVIPSSLLIAKYTKQTRTAVPAPAPAPLKTVLAIDGGGVRGLIALRSLVFLERKLQELHGDEARISDFYDVITGTSTGALIAVMLCVPDLNNRPRYTAKDIFEFYIEKSPLIFRKKFVGFLSSFLSWVHSIFRPKYDGRNLHDIVKEIMGDTTIDQTLTNVVITTYDIKLGKSIIFSTSEAKINVSMNARLSDICISTCAAPTYFPAHHFTTQNLNDELVEFNLIDGGVAANNPTLIGMRHADPSTKHDFLVLSLGTGMTRDSFTASETTKWGIFKWAKPLINTLMTSSAEMVEAEIPCRFKPGQFETNYLRIQDDTLTGDASSLDVATEENLQNLAERGDRLLKKPTASWIGKTICVRTKSLETNGEALTQHAKLLSDHERKQAVAQYIQSCTTGGEGDVSICQ